MEKNMGTIDTQLSEDENKNSSTYGDMSKNKKTYERTAVAGTPFIRHYSEDEGYSLGIAEHRLTGWYKTEKEIDKVQKGIINNGINWDMLTGVILILIEKTLELKKLNDKIESQN